MSFSPRRRQAMIAAAGAGLLTLNRPLLAAEAYPSRGVRMVVPFPAGGPTDIVGRPLAKLLGDRLGQSVYIDNRGGAGGSIGADVVAKAAPDGYTILLGTVGTSAINATLYKNLPHDPVKDFTPLSGIASAPVAVVVNPDSGFKSLRDLVEAARAKPGSINYGSAGNGTPGHLTGAMFCKEVGIKLTHVPYKGSAPAVVDLLGGQIPLMFDPVQSVLPHVKGGKLRALAITSQNRVKVLPDVPTVSESGWKGFEATAWWAVFGPAGMPGPVTQRLTKELQGIVADPGFVDMLAEIGVQSLTKPLAEYQKSELQKWGLAVKDTGLSLE